MKFKSNKKDMDYSSQIILLGISNKYITFKLRDCYIGNNVYIYDLTTRELKKLNEICKFTQEDYFENAKFERGILHIDTNKKIIYSYVNKNQILEYNYGKGTINSWEKFDWENQIGTNYREFMPQDFYSKVQFYDNSIIGFVHGGGYYYTLYLADSNGMVVNLHGNGGGGGIENLNIIDDWAYWDDGLRVFRVNVKNGKNMKFNERTMFFEDYIR